MCERESVVVCVRACVRVCMLSGFSMGYRSLVLELELLEVFLLSCNYISAVVCISVQLS